MKLLPQSHLYSTGSSRHCSHRLLAVANGRLLACLHSCKTSGSQVPLRGLCDAHSCKLVPVPACGSMQLAKAHATPCPSPQQAKSRSHSLMDKLTRACSGQSTAESDPMSGGVWVDVVDPDGRR